MKHSRGGSHTTAGAHGFSMIELMVVVGIIMLLLAVTGPAILNYLRTYRIRGAVQNLTGDLQAARNRAIMKNVNLGVAVVVQDATTYWTHIEDDQSLPREPIRQTLNMTAPDAVQSVRRRLPPNVEFASALADCPTVAGFAPGDSGIRFNRLGAACDPGVNVLCPAVTVAGGATANVVYTTAAGSTLCLVDRQANLHRNVTITPGGRVRFQQ